MKVKTTFSTILTLMCVLMFSFAANAEKNYSFHNHPSRPSKDANELFMKQYLGVVADGYTTGNAYEYVQVGTETGTDYLVPRHFVKNNSGSYYVTFGPKKDGDYNDNYEYVGSGGTQTVYKAGKTSASGSTRCNDVAASFTTTNPNLAGIEKVWAKQSVPKINYAKSFQPYQEGGKTITGPSLVAENQVVIFEVNQYWRGARQVYGNDKGTVDGTDGYRWSNEWNQCYYGIENIITEGITETAIPASSYTTGGRTVTTQGGTLYGYTGELGRFFFAKRRANNEETNGYKTDYSTSGNNYREMLLRWYNEWSTVDDQKKGWDGFSSSNHWDDVMGGDVYRAPHNCSSSLETNHFISLYGMDSEGTKKPLTILFYIDKSTPVSTRDITDVSQQPFMFGYYGEQLELSKQTTTVEGKAYDIKVTFRSNYNTVRPSTVPFYDAATRTGVTEYFDIWRKKADGTYEKIEENLPSNSNKLTEVTVSGIKYYQYLDKGFEDGGEAGYDVEYYIVPSLWHVSPKSGSTTEVTQDAFVAKTATGTQTIHIAGTEALILYGSTTSQFTASKFENKADTGKNPYYESDGTNKNEGKHILKPVSDCSTKMGSNDKVVLVRIKGTQETILKTGTTGSGKTV
ncbi:MAG: hypothetical protein HUJ98_11865, partial [Bacteroidaceae bacterium]|nr:hypothetical protein [Bacteroidaceae bacterium]